MATIDYFDSGTSTSGGTHYASYQPFSVREGYRDREFTDEELNAIGNLGEPKSVDELLKAYQL